MLKEGHNFEACKICGAESRIIFSKQILKKYQINYFQCPKCYFSQTEEPYWLAEAYRNSMNIGDTGQVYRLIRCALFTKIIIRNLLNSNGKFLDYAGGYGMFTRIMRDFGFSFFWDDLFTENLLAKGFELSNSGIDNFEAITVFECFEHWNDPMAEIERIFEKTDTIIFTTNLISYPAPKEWWYYGFDHGQHISFYSQKSFKVLEEKFNAHFFTKNGIHILSKKKINGLIYKCSIIEAKILIKLLNFFNLPSLTSSDHSKLIK